MSQQIDVTTVAPGVARLEWGSEHVVDEVRREVARALTSHARVEALVDPEDTAAQRTATWSGLRREGVMRGLTVDGEPMDRILYARLVSDDPVTEPAGFRALLNSFLPRKRAIAQMLLRDPDDRVLLCQLTYKRDRDLPGGVVEVGESPQLAATREVEEELGLKVSSGGLLLTDWLPPWGGWDDAVCLVFDGGVHDPAILDRVVKQEREIKEAAFLNASEIAELATDFTARRVAAALTAAHTGIPGYTESGR